jgi:GNAT superfamily N-acetyltransferase
MDRDALLALYDHHERREARPVGLRVELGPHTVRHVGAPGASGWVIWSALAHVDADAAIAAEQARFASLRQGFEWKHFGHDAPADLLERLLAAGFVAEETEALMGLDLDDAPAGLERDGDHDVRSMGLEGWDDVVQVLVAVWPHLAEGFVPRFRAEIEAAPERVRLFVAYLDGAPAAAGWTLDGGAGSPFLGLFGGATLAEHRGRGLYRALVAARARFARALGTRWLTVDAGPMSAPILERLGFVALTTTTPCLWRSPVGPSPAARGRSALADAPPER